jgi:hypothetical protein
MEAAGAIVHAIRKLVLAKPLSFEVKPRRRLARLLLNHRLR